MAKPLQQKQFNAIMRTIRDLKKVGTFKSVTVAEEHGVSVSTVNAIRRGKTWQGYQAELAKYQAKRQNRTESTLDTDLKRLEKNPVNYVTPEQLDAALKGFVTKKQLTDGIDSAKGAAKNARERANDAHDRIDKHWKRLNRHGRLLSKIIARKPRWFPED